MNMCFLLITGSIAAVRAPEIVRALQNKNFDVHCVLTKSAREFVTPRALAALTKNPVLENEWWSEKKMKPGILAEPEYEHLDFAKKADVLLVAPATADTISRLVSGRASGLFEATVLASRAPLLLAPAMNTQMLFSTQTQKNITQLQDRGAVFLPTKDGVLACGDEGTGKMLSSEDISFFAKKATLPQTLQGKRVLITLGATQEMLDPVRCLTNISSGKMGYTLAVQAFLQGAEVVIIAGKNSAITYNESIHYALEARGKKLHSSSPMFTKVIPVVSAKEMLDATKKEIKDCDYAFFVAAVCDFTPEKMEEEKISTENSPPSEEGREGVAKINWKKTPDIAAEMGKEKKKNQKFFGFALQTGTQKDAEEKARAKMKTKNLDGIFLNFPSNLQKEEGELLFLHKNGEKEKMRGSKMKMAESIFKSL